jgi:peroxiredoxin
MPLSTGKAAPAFELATTDGHPQSLVKALEMGPVLTVFFKVTCPTCQYTFPFLERLWQQLRAYGVQIWGISQDNTRDTHHFMKEYGVTFPILIDDYPYETSRAFGLKYVPTIFLVGRDGQVTISSEGFSKVDLLEIQNSLAKFLSVSLAPLFQPKERVPEYKPG